MTPRQALIVKIHTARKALGLDEANYRGLLARVGGKPSCAALSIAALEAVAAEMRRLGWREAGCYRRKANAPAHVRMIYGLWTEAGRCGALKSSSKEALRAFVARQTQVSAPEFLRNAKAAAPVIEALKRMIARTNEEARE